MSKALIERFTERYVELQKLPKNLKNTRLYWWYSDARASGLTWYDIAKIRGVTDASCVLQFSNLERRYNANRAKI